MSPLMTMMSLKRRRPAIKPCVIKMAATYAAANDRFHSPAAPAGLWARPKNRYTPTWPLAKAKHALGKLI